MLSEDQKKAFDEFYKSARQNEILDPKATVMVHMAAAMALGCYPCMKHYFAQAKEVALTDEELGAVQAIVMAVAAGKVHMQVQDVLAGGERGSTAPCKEGTEPDDVERPGRLICEGIWGGIRDLDQEVSAGPVRASLYASSCDGGKGGDIYYFGVCKGEKLMRVAIADVVGHGQVVSDVSQYIYNALKARMCHPDSGAILSRVNRVAAQRGVKALTTAAVVAYSSPKGAFLVSSAGHPPLLLKSAKQRNWSALASADSDKKTDGPVTDLPLAIEPDAVYNQQVVPAATGDRIFLYTDGVIEAPNAEGELFGDKRLKNVLDGNADAPLSELKAAVLAALKRHTGNGLTHDDVTTIVMEVR